MYTLLPKKSNSSKHRGYEVFWLNMSQHLTAPFLFLQGILAASQIALLLDFWYKAKYPVLWRISGCGGRPKILWIPCKFLSLSVCCFSARQMKASQIVQLFPWPHAKLFHAAAPSSLPHQLISLWPTASLLLRLQLSHQTFIPQYWLWYLNVKFVGSREHTSVTPDSFFASRVSGWVRTSSIFSHANITAFDFILYFLICT